MPSSVLNLPMTSHCPPRKTKLSSRPCPLPTLIFPMLPFNHGSSHNSLPHLRAFAHAVPSIWSTLPLSLFWHPSPYHPLYCASDPI